MKLLPLLVAAFLFGGCIALPSGLSVYVTPDGCLPDGVTCPYGQGSRANYYWAPSRTLVFQPNQGTLTQAHELCHAHQHAVILQDLGREPSNVNLEDWYLTGEGRSFVAAFGWDATPPAPHPWQYLSNPNALEDFANTCSYWLIKPDELARLSPTRAAWSEEWLQ